MHCPQSRTLYKYKKLSDRITKKFGTQAKFAEAMKLSERSISLKLNNKVEWKQNEILRASKLLGICPIEIQDYFFDIDFHGNELFYLSSCSQGMEAVKNALSEHCQERLSSAPLSRV